MTATPPFKIKSILGSRAVIVITVSALLLLAALTALPFAAREAALSWLVKNGIARARIDNVDINLFSGTVAVEGVQLLSLGGETSSLGRFSVDLAMRDLTKKHVRIESLHAEGLNLGVVRQGETFTLGGITLPPPSPDEEPPSAWLVGLDAVKIQGCEVAVALPDLALRLNLADASLTHLHAWSPDTAGRLEVTGGLNTRPLRIALDLTPFAASPAVKGTLQLAGFPLADFQRLAKAHVSGLKGELTIDTRLAVTHNPENGTTIGQAGTLALNHLGGTLNAQGVDLNTMDLSWTGDLKVALDASGALADLTSQGTLGSARLDAVLTQQGLHLRHDGLVWDGSVNLDPRVEEGMALRGDLTLEKASASKSGKKLGALARLSVVDLKAKGLKSLQTPHIALKGLKALPPLAAIGSIDLTGVALDNQKHLRAKSVIIGGVALTLVRDAEGKLTVSKELDTLSPAPPKTHKKTAAPSTTATVATAKHSAAPQNSEFTVKIGTFRMTGDKFLQVTDRSVTPAFTKTLGIKRFELRNFDSTAPKRDLPVTLEAKLGPYETIAIAGTIRPYDPKGTAHLETRIANIDLSALSPYSSKAMGYLIETGTFSTETKLALDSGMAEISNQFTFNNLELVPDDAETMDKIMKTLTMPLDFALSILKDKNNTINLDIPLSGDIQSPDVSIASVVKIATVKAVTTASVTYLSYLLQPYSAILMVADQAGEFATKIRLDPVGFDLTYPLPSQAGRDYLKSVSSLMKTKEVLKLTVCANAVTGDIVPKVLEPKAPGAATPTPAATPAPVDEALYHALARQRAEAIRDILVTDGIDPGRIILCLPHFKVAEQEKPEALLTL